MKEILARLSGGRNPKRPLTIDDAAEGLTACYLNGINLLEDARLLAANAREPRALAIVILALEELGKVPDLDDVILDPRSRSDSNVWADFWQRFISHKPKQKRIASYGNVLREASELDEVLLENSTPYAVYLTDNSFGHLDNVKQRGFYVDFLGDRFHVPRADADVSAALDSLFAFAEERADSFGSWHITAQRSLDFLNARLKVFTTPPSELGDLLKHIHSFNAWASSHSDDEAQADLQRLLCYHSSALIPDYAQFLPACEAFLAGKTPDQTLRLIGRAVVCLRARMALKPLQRSAHRAFLMFKLLLSYATRHLQEADCKRIFDVSPSDDARSHFRNGF